MLGPAGYLRVLRVSGRPASSRGGSRSDPQSSGSAFDGNASRCRDVASEANPRCARAGRPAAAVRGRSSERTDLAATDRNTDSHLLCALPSSVLHAEADRHTACDGNSAPDTCADALAPSYGYSHGHPGAVASGGNADTRAGRDLPANAVTRAGFVGESRPRGGWFVWFRRDDRFVRLDLAALPELIGFWRFGIATKSARVLRISFALEHESSTRASRITTHAPTP